MRLWWLCSGLLLALGTNAAVDFDCTGRENRMYAEGCSDHFIWCWDGLARRERCVAGLFFSEAGQDCTFRTLVKECGGHAPPPRPTSPPGNTTPKPNFDCEKMPNGDYADPAGGCVDHFFVCSNSYAFRRRCPAGLAFDGGRRLCDYKERVADCGGAVPTILIPSPGTSTSSSSSGSHLRQPVNSRTGHRGYVERVRPSSSSGSHLRQAVNSRTGHRGYVDQVRSSSSFSSGGAVPAFIINSPGTSSSSSSSGPYLRQAANSRTGHRGYVERVRPSSSSSSGGAVPAFIIPSPGTSSSSSSGPHHRQAVNSRTGHRGYNEVAAYNPVADPTDPPAPVDGHCLGQPDGTFLAMGHCKSVYCECVEERAIFRTCENGEVFDPNTRDCREVTEVAECAPPTTPTPISTPIPNSHILCVGQADGTFIAIGPCTQDYYECLNYKPIFKTCEEGEIFSVQSRSCEVEEDVAACNPVADPTDPPTTTDSHCLGQPDGTFLAMGHCESAYCECLEERAIFRTCENGEIFDSSTKECREVTEVAECAPPTTTTTPISTPIPNSHNLCVGQADGTLIAIGTCNQDYCECLDYKPIFKACEEGEIFSVESRSCEAAAEVATCNPVADPTDPPPPIDGHCLGQPDGTFLAMGHCESAYCECLEERAIFRTCENGEVFDPNTKECREVTEVAECAPPTTSTPSSTRIPNSHNLCVGQVDGTFIAIGPCNQEYCECLDYKPIFKTCEEDEIFSVESRSCEAEEDVAACNPVADPTDPPTPIDGHCLGQPDGTFLAMGHCESAYCECLEERAIFRTCENGEVFDPNTRDCREVTEVAECAPPTTPTPIPNSHNFCVGQADGTFIAIGPCNQEYCECLDYKPIFKTCEEDEIFSLESRSCEAEEDVAACNPVADPTDPPTPIDRHCLGHPDGTLLVFGHCENTYSECVEERAIFRTCENGEVFDLYTRECREVTEVAECAPTTTPTPIPNSRNCCCD